MKKYLATAVTAGICFVSGCMDKGPESPKSTGPTTMAAMPATMPATMPSMTASTEPSWDAPVMGKPVFFHVRAEGVQIYEPKVIDGKLAWSLKAPEALLYDDKGRNVGTHMGSPAGPVWVYTLDGSKIVGKKEGMLEQPGTIPWVLVSVVSHDGPKGKLTPVGYLKRIDTSGGLPPSTPPTPEQKEERVGYRATYLFYAGK